MRVLTKKNSSLRCLIDEAYETVHLHYYMLICLTQFSVPENVNSGSRNISKKKRKTIDLAIGIKLIKHFI